VQGLANASWSTALVSDVTASVSLVDTDDWLTDTRVSYDTVAHSYADQLREGVERAATAESRSTGPPSATTPWMATKGSLDAAVRTIQQAALREAEGGSEMQTH
jgi:hypothetical protein